MSCQILYKTINKHEAHIPVLGPYACVCVCVIYENLHAAADANLIAVNPPEFFVIIWKSKLEYTLPNNWFYFRIMESHFFFFSPPCPVYDPVCPPAAINIHAIALILHCSAWAACYSLTVPVHVRHFLQLQGARPLPEPSPIRNYKLGSRLPTLCSHCAHDHLYWCTHTYAHLYSPLI